MALCCVYVINIFSSLNHQVIEQDSRQIVLNVWYMMSYFTSVLQIIPYSSTIKTDRHDVTEILLKVALNTTTNQTIL